MLEKLWADAVNEKKQKHKMLIAPLKINDSFFKKPFILQSPLICRNLTRPTLRCALRPLNLN
jgi:hypothetical protein